MDQQNPTLAKIPIRDTGKFKQWQFRIQKYLQHEHYALWEVIKFGDSYEAPANVATTSSASEGTGKKKGRTVTLTTDDMQKRKIDVKARTILLLSLPNEHQLRFSKYKTTQELWAAILKTFGGNEATKKTKKNLLKQQYGNFKAEGSETLEKMFNRLQNMAFISSAKHNSGNEEVNIASGSTASINVSTASANIGAVTISQDTACAYIASQSSGSQIKFEDINQIDEDDMEEMDIKWNMALLSMRADRQRSKVEEQAPKALMAIDGVGWDWSYMVNDEENHALIADEETPTEFALMAKTSAESEVFDNSLCSKACKKNSDSLNSKITKLTDKLYDAKNMIYHYKLALAQVEARLANHRNQELKYCEKIRVLEFKNESSADCIESLKKELELIKKEKEGMDGKLAAFQTASKDLDNLLESQRLDKNKEGLGYSAVPPPPAQVYSPPKKNLSWTGLPEFKDDTVTNYSRPSPAIESTSDDAQNRNPSKASPSTISSKSYIKFVKANDSPTKSKTNKVETAKKPLVKYAEQYKKPTKKPNVRGNQKNWNNLKSHQLGPNFVMEKKACFNCGDFNHLAYDCSKRDSSCSRHMTCNISYLSDYKPFDGGYVSFGQGGCKITGKGTIKTDKLEFENVYFVKDLKYNMFSVSQICDNKNSVLFTDSKCIVLGRDFKPLDDANVLLRTLRQHNMYSIDLNNIVPHKDLTCLVAKASADEGMLWHRRLVIDDFYRFTWTFFFKTKDETSGILRKFITEIENLKNLKVKIIRCDNGGEFRNKEMDDFCSQKGIKREFSNSRTSQQNGVAERRNMTLIEAARTILADAKLPVTFWAEAVNTACYVQNRVLVNKSHNKIPYELFNGRSPAIEFLKPFRCHVMILNTLDHLGKFEAKGDEGYFIRYSMSRKAFRVFNKRTKKVEKNLHVEFLENKAIEKGAGPN
nr:ribonuclease H-like domain-containing protein [Tanacetum cinerariifolium]GEX80184.1 ribonuclease H-like domain-containing protein [Tanacetum cinerariifolium]